MIIIPKGVHPAVMLAVLLLTACSPEAFRLSRPDPESCRKLEASIDRNIKHIAISEVQGASDKSAAQQAARAGDNANRFAAIMATLHVHTENGCTPRKHPIDPFVYDRQATACYFAMAKASLGNSTDAEAKAAAEQCDISKWSPER